MTEFSIPGYRSLLVEFEERGYRSVSFFDVDVGQRHLLLRHDIDMSIPAALEIARLETCLGCQASYFVLLGSELYNVLAPDSIRGLRELLALGHEVGLHFDATAYEGAEADLEAAAERECDILEQSLGVQVRMISFHRPAERFLGMAERIAGRLHSYMPRFFSEIGYCSDSRGAWRSGKPLEHPAVRGGRALQLLTHPIWWVSRGTTPVAKLNGFLNDRLDRLKRELGSNCEPYRDYLSGVREQ